MLEGKRVLVTGAAGFVGSNLVRELVRQGSQVTCLVKPGEDTFRIAGVPCRVLEGDITRKQTLLAAVTGVDYIFHLAALLGAHLSNAFHLINVEGTKNLFQACLEQGVALQRFLFVSSLAAVGPSGKNRILDETAPCQPVSAYGQSKLMAEHYLHSRKGALPLTIVRLPCVYGPWSNGGISIAFKLASQGIFLIVPDGKLNVLYVEDAVRGMIEAAVNPVTLGQTYHLGENNIYSMRQICRIIARATGKRLLPVYTPYPLLYSISYASEVLARIRKKVPFLTRHDLSAYLKYRFWQFDTSKAAREFNFAIRYPLEKGVAAAAAWYTQNGFR